MKIWTGPKLTVVSRPEFLEPGHLPVRWLGNGTPGERLVEYSGRLCYASQQNRSGRGTEAYLQNILSQGHGSVLEHAVWGVLVEGVSRSLSHELVRHRAGTAFSQLSQRYVAGEVGVVVPPAVGDLPQYDFGTWCDRAEGIVGLYRAQREEFEWAGLKGKRLEEAARAFLPNCTETKLVMSANARAWRHIVELRAGEGADAEMRRFARALLATLKPEAPSLFGDLDGETGKTRWGKV